MPERNSGSGGGAPMTFSQVPGSPTFRSSNAIAVIPLLSSTRDGHDNSNTHSSQSFRDLLAALLRYQSQNETSPQSSGSADGMLLVVPNSNLTRPGDWKYDKTPLRNFHWGHGCQRMTFFDGRPYNSRMAHDRLINHELTRNWIDLCPHRRTAAVIGVLNVRDCPDEETLKRAQEEWKHWAERYSTPPYEVSAHGRDLERDPVVQRLFVFDSFHETNKVDISASLQGSRLVAFPPTDKEHTHMMDLHMNVVVHDLAVAVFRELEYRIQGSDAMVQENDTTFTTPAKQSRFFSRTSSNSNDEESPMGSDNLSINSLAAVVSPDSKLAAKDVSKKATSPPLRSPIASKLQSSVVRNVKKGSSTQAQLLTPMDDVFDITELNPKDAHEIMRREVGRREKIAADLSLLAGSPLDAYERYMKAAELCRSTCPDPLWYAAALEGCVAAHIAMAEMGGFNVDEYLDASFQLPDEIMACVVTPSGEKSTKQDMPSIVAALCDDALNILSRHSRLACFRAELLLKLAWYTAEVEDAHERCLWGKGEACYGGDANNSKMRWEKSSANQHIFAEFKNKKGEDVIARNTLMRSKKFSSYLHQAVAAGALDPVTRADVALRCASLCLRGLRPTLKPTSKEISDDRLVFKRKAAFFATAAAETMSEIAGGENDTRVGALWSQTVKLLPNQCNMYDTGNYGWATLRAIALHGLTMQGIRDTSEGAAVQLLALMGEITPSKNLEDNSLMLSRFDEEHTHPSSMDDSFTDSQSENQSYIAAGESVVSAARSAARTYVRETRAKVAEARRANFFSGVNKDSSLLTVAQSKWVEDEEIPTILLPLAEFSDISECIIATRAVWSAIKFESCFASQKKVVKEITELRKRAATTTLASDDNGASKALSLPLKVVSVRMVDTEGHAKLERVKVKVKQEDTGAMATFYNPFANKKGQDDATIVPEGEERYVLVSFANNLSIPLEIPRCQLEFNTARDDRIKAPAISFVIPGQTKDFAVQFPFIVLAQGGVSVESENQSAGLSFEIKGLHLTCLARSFFVPLYSGSDDAKGKLSTLPPGIPENASLYPRRDYTSENNDAKKKIRSPRIEIVPAQPNLMVSFASSASPIDDNTVIPVQLADGEVFSLPKFFISNDAGISGNGTLEELKITASGLPGYSEISLLHLSAMDELTELTDEKMKAARKGSTAAPIFLSANFDGIINKTSLNSVNKNTKKNPSMLLRLTASNDLGAHVRGSTVKVSFRYRGKAPSSTVEVWRKKVIEVRILRIKGPRISSITFRSDLNNWDSGFRELCVALSRHDKHARYYSSGAYDEQALPTAGSTDEHEFVKGRLGFDRGVHTCGETVVAILAVANESSSAITLSSPNGPVGGFPGNAMETVKVNPGVSAKIPIVRPRVDRKPGIDIQLTSMTRLQWKTEVSELADGDTNDIGGTIVPVNMRSRMGSIEIPRPCLKTIIDENPTMLSKICKSPCSIKVSIADEVDSSPIHVAIQKPVRVSVDIELMSWIPDSVLKETKFVLEFCCARKGNESREVEAKSNLDFVWCGHIRKGIQTKSVVRKQVHSARLLFLREGEYFVSACLSIERTVVHDDVKEIWWAEKAKHVHVQSTHAAQ